ncbi:MAG: ribosome silencing factor [Gammaproteobacteria bacterium]|nr:ribosome silencing factor [Gammaproteobacteria bacterium]NNM00345.1 ribosome silencing factor [Gammaproteobacteria bacterium]
MQDANTLLELVTAALEDGKAINIQVIDVHKQTTITDYMVIASGGSARQVKALAERVVESAKKNGTQPLGVEGTDTAEWVLIDLGDVVVHAMQPLTREFYQLEKLWTHTAESASAGRGTAP